MLLSSHEMNSPAHATNGNTAMPQDHVHEVSDPRAGRASQDERERLLEAFHHQAVPIDRPAVSLEEPCAGRASPCMRTRSSQSSSAG